MIAYITVIMLVIIDPSSRLMLAVLEVRRAFALKHGLEYVLSISISVSSICLLSTCCRPPSRCHFLHHTAKAMLRLVMVFGLLQLVVVLMMTCRRFRGLMMHSFLLGLGWLHLVDKVSLSLLGRRVESFLLLIAMIHHRR